jgi:hypothetical protein
LNQRQRRGSTVDTADFAIHKLSNTVAINFTPKFVP